LFSLVVAAQRAEKGIPTLFIAGDSTAAEYRGVNPRGGWGEFLGSYFDAQRLKVVNAARGGRSIRTFVSEGHWENLLAQGPCGRFHHHPIRGNRWQEGAIECASGTYRTWTWQIAKSEKVAFVDLTRIISDRVRMRMPPTW